MKLLKKDVKFSVKDQYLYANVHGHRVAMTGKNCKDDRDVLFERLQRLMEIREERGMKNQGWCK